MSLTPQLPRLVVAMAAHNTERYIERALESIERVCGESDREYLVFVADDASVDGTHAIASAFAARSKASVFRCLTFPKAKSVGEAKNRAVIMASGYLRPSDWVLFLDDDDEMLPGRVEMIRVAEVEGETAVVGRYCHTSESGGPIDVDVEKLVPELGFSPGCTAVRGSLIQPDGRYFMEVPSDCAEDYCTHLQMVRRGVSWRYIKTNSPVLLFRVRPDSLTAGRGQALLESSKRYMAESQPSEASVNVRPPIQRVRVPTGKPSVGIVCCSLSAGGVERWVSMLIAATRNDFNWVGVGAEGSVSQAAREMIGGVQCVEGVDQCVSLAKRCDILIIWATAFTHRYKYESSAKLVMTHHGGPGPWQASVVKAVPSELITAVHSCSNYATKALTNPLLQKTRVIYNVVSDDVVTPSRSKEDVLSRHGIPDDWQVASMVCRLSHEKRWMLGMAGIARVHGAHGVLCGGSAAGAFDAHAQAILDSLSPSLTYVGWQRNVGDILQISSALVAVSNRSEGCQYTLMEAALAGVPIVSTPFGVAHDHPEIVSAMLPEDPSIDDVTTACVEALSWDRRVCETVDVARDLMESKYNPSWWRKQWVSFFKDI